MKDYKVTLLVTSIGYYSAIALVLLVTLGGAVAQGLLGAFTAFVVGGLLVVPFLMFCEGMHALVTIANNTKKPEDQVKLSRVA